MLQVACLQLFPVFKDVPKSIEKADKLLESLDGTVDLLVLPEMAFTGYVFDSKAEVAPFVSKPKDSETYKWCARTAARFSCFVLAGFAECDSEGAFYNSQMCVAPDASLVYVYRKHFLFTTDLNWATEGPSFKVFDLDLSLLSPKIFDRPSVRVAPVICMDLNPFMFEAPFDRYEAGSFIAEQTPPVDIVVCSMNWLDPELGPDDFDDMKEVSLSKFTRQELWDSVAFTLSYWVTRLSPVLGSETYFVGANRCGTEKDVVFVGTSTVLKLSDPPRISVYAHKYHQDLIRASLLI